MTSNTGASGSNAKTPASSPHATGPTTKSITKDVKPADVSTSRGNGSTLPYWPRYDLASPRNIVLEANGSYVEEDTYRKEGMAFLNEVASDLQILS